MLMGREMGIVQKSSNFVPQIKLRDFQNLIFRNEFRYQFQIIGKTNLDSQITISTWVRCKRIILDNNEAQWQFVAGVKAHKFSVDSTLRSVLKAMQETSI